MLNPEILGVGLVLLVAVVIAVLLWRVLRTRLIVRRTSTALGALVNLNERFAASVAAAPAIRRRYQAAPKTKAQFDRFDFSTFAAGCVLEDEASLTAEVRDRRARVRYYADYAAELDLIRGRDLGTSSDARLRLERYRYTESRLFEKAALAYPEPLAEVVFTVTYTSPKGRSSHSWPSLVWDFEQLQLGLASARIAREDRSSAVFQRSLMTPSLRTDVLRRDGHRCRMCGASPSTGATLHVDHIRPVSRGGKTVPENLQTLCQTCNLGKGNRFVG